MNARPHSGGRVTVALAGLTALLSTIVVLAVSGAHEGHAASNPTHKHAVPGRTSRQLALRVALCKL